METIHEGPTKNKLKAAVQELVDTIDGYFAFSGFEFLAGEYSQGNFRFPKEQWVERWMNSFEPRLPAAEGMIEQREKWLCVTLSNNKEALDVLKELSNDRVDASTARWELGFYLGIFVGAKMMGASRERLDQLGQKLIEVILARSRFE